MLLSLTVFWFGVFEEVLFGGWGLWRGLVCFFVGLFVLFFEGGFWVFQGFFLLITEITISCLAALPSPLFVCW